LSRSSAQAHRVRAERRVTHSAQGGEPARLVPGLSGGRCIPEKVSSGGPCRFVDRSRISSRSLVSNLMRVPFALYGLPNSPSLPQANFLKAAEPRAARPQAAPWHGTPGWGAPFTRVADPRIPSPLLWSAGPGSEERAGAFLLNRLMRGVAGALRSSRRVADWA
jgi:hypothetical protein